MKNELIVISGAAPGNKTGYELAVRSNINALKHAFSKIHLIHIGKEKWQNDLRHIEYCYVDKSKASAAFFFLRSLFCTLPAVAIPYFLSRKQTRRVIQRIVESSSPETRFTFLYEDVPLASLLPVLQKQNPGSLHIIRSHNFLTKAFRGIQKHESIVSGIAWRIESWKIPVWEKKICAKASAIWAITDLDAKMYQRVLGTTIDAVIGVTIDVAHYRDVQSPHPASFIHIGSADIRKGLGIKLFIEKCWPRIRKASRDARLYIAGKNTEQFTDPEQNILGLGCIDDDKTLLNKGNIFVNTQFIGAGLKIKSLIAMAAHKLLISTVTGVEGIHGKNGTHYLVGHNWSLFLEQCIYALRDENRSNSIATNGHHYVARHCNEEKIKQDTLKAIERFLN